jgi:transposase-like protein
MSKVNRNAPKMAGGSEARYTIFHFDREFPDDAACLDYLVGKLYPDGIRCPKCQRVTKHHRVKSRPAYSCQFCGHYEYPMAGTIFQDSATSLRLWFYGIFLMASTRCGISAKQLERELGVTYKTAWRMFNKIRSLLSQDGDPLTGAIEADEAYIGGQGKWKHASKRGHDTAFSSKTPVFGMAQRGANGGKGKVVAQVVEAASGPSILPKLKTRVLPESMIYTDEGNVYDSLKGQGYAHQRVNHSQQIYVDGTAHVNTIEGFWSLLKSGIRGTYHSVSTQHLQSYLDEYAFRYNNREATGRGMFDAFLSRIEKAPPAS